MYINKHKLRILVVLCVYDIRTKFPIIKGKQCRSSFTSMGMGGTKTPCISGFSLIYLFKRIVGNWSFLSSPESFSQAGILKSKEPGVWGWFSPVCAVEDALIYTLLTVAAVDRRTTGVNCAFSFCQRILPFPLIIHASEKPESSYASY